MRLLVLLVGLLIVPASSTASPGVPGKVTKEQFTHGGRQVPYFLFVPKAPTAPASAPLLVLFHGSARDGSSIVEPWKELAEKEGIVLVAPDAQNPQRWNVPVDGPETVCALVDQLRQSLPVVNPRRLYLFGHSGGAVFVLYMAMLESDYFAAGALHAGAWRSPEEFTSVDLLGRRIPLALTVGSNDRFFSLDAVNATADALKKAGVPVVTRVIPNHDHNYYVMSGDVNEWAWTALKGHVLPAEPVYTPRVFR